MSRFDRDLQHLLGLGEILRVLGRDQRMAEHRGDHRRVARALRRFAQRRDRLLRLAALEQDLALQLEEIGIVRVGREQRVRLGLRLVGIAAEVIGIGARIMRRNALVALGIFARPPASGST